MRPIALLNSGVTLTSSYRTRRGASDPPLHPVVAPFRSSATFGVRPLADRHKLNVRLALPADEVCDADAGDAEQSLTTNTSGGTTPMTTMAVNAPRSGGMTGEL